MRHVRTVGAQTGVISTGDLDAERLVRKAKEHPTLIGRDLVRDVSCVEPYDWHQGRWHLEHGYETPRHAERFVVAYDYGIKWNILRNLAAAGCRVRVVPASTPAEDVLDMNPSGIFLSNGPGDPDAVTYAIDNVAKLVGKKPLFGICLGHQILGLALGGKTYKLKFGHHGGNQPVMDLTTRKVEITAQNHGFAVDVDSLKGLAELTPREPERQDRRGPQRAEPPGLLRPVPSRSVPGPPRRQLPLPEIHEAHRQGRDVSCAVFATGSPEA